VSKDSKEKKCKEFRGELFAGKRARIIAFILAFIIVAPIMAATFYLSPYMFTRPVKEVVWTNEALVSADYDVIVVGAEPEGIAAAVSAARNGAKTLLLESSQTLGGLMTLGKLNFLDMCIGRDGTLLTRGFFSEFYDAVGGSAFDITDAKNYFLKVVTEEPLITLRTQSGFSAPVMDGDRITGVMMLENGREVVYTGKRIIDATADGDVAAMAGAPYTYGGEDIGEIGRKMGVTLIFELEGVNWWGVFFHLNAVRLRNRINGNQISVGASNRVAWGYEQEGYAYVPADPTIRLRGFNIARQRGGTVLINAMVIYDVDPLDGDSYTDAVRRANAELEHLLPYIRGSFAGFRKARLVSTASRLYVRESRHFIGEYQLSIDDVLENRDQWDKIAIGSYPADVQPSNLQPYGNVIGNPDRYAVPFRSLVPQNVENLLIVGRSASFTSQAASSARVLPLGMVCGQAAGTAAAQSIRENMSFREMSGDLVAIAALQATLVAQNAYLEDFEISEPIMSHWAYEGLAALRRLGLLEGGYNNDYRLEDAIDSWRFQYMLKVILRNAGYSLEDVPIDDPPTNAAIADIVASVCLGVRELPLSSPGSGQTGGAPADTPLMILQPDIFISGRSHGENLELLSEMGVLGPSLAEFFRDGGAVPHRAETIMLLYNLGARV